MASIAARVPQNVHGKFYVDFSCIYCGLCEQTAPTVFRECNEQGWAYVFHQPETAQELHQAIEALEGCPTASIGRDAKERADMSTIGANQSIEPTGASLSGHFEFMTRWRLAPAAHAQR